jgi:hypothetical protein
MTGMCLTFNLLPNFLRPLAWLVLAGLLAAMLAVSASASQDPGLAALGGEGAAAISGFVIADVNYAVSDSQPGRLKAVSLSVVGPDGWTTPTRVSVSLVPGQPSSACLRQSASRWTCPLDLPVAAAESLQVSASR